jgi:hypothetical protein
VELPPILVAKDDCHELVVCREMKSRMAKRSGLQSILETDVLARAAHTRFAIAGTLQLFECRYSPCWKHVGSLLAAQWVSGLESVQMTVK